MAENIESEQHDLLPLGKSEISIAKVDLFQRGLQLVKNLAEGTRTINFPKDQAIGNLLTTYTPNPPRSSLDFFVKIGEAQGEISVPADIFLILKVGDQYPNDLSPLTSLKPSDIDALIIKNSQVEDHELQNLQRLTGLRELALHGCMKITDKGLLPIQRLHSLERVEICESRIGDAGLRQLRMLTSLKSLYLQKIPITSLGLQVLENFPSLRSCSLRFINTINDEGIIHLGRLSKLENLSLPMTNVGDAGLFHLRKLTSLRYLCLSLTHVTDVGVEHLLGLRNLKYLDLLGTSVTDVDFAIIKKHLPNCEFVIGDALGNECNSGY